MVATGGGMISRERKKDRQRQPWRPAGRPVTTGAEARQARTRVREVEYATGRTIALGEFEFARAEIRLVAGGLKREALLEAMRAIAAEWLDREEAAITGVPREAQPYAALAGLRRSVGIGYGMTLRGAGKRETVKFDVFQTEPVADGAGIGTVLDGIMTWVEAKAKEEKEAVTGGAPDEGI